VQRGHEGVPADAVEHYVDTGAVSKVAHAHGHVLIAVIYYVVAAARACEIALPVGRHRANDGEPQQLGPLRDDQSDAAGGGMQQENVARLELMDAAQEVSS